MARSTNGFERRRRKTRDAIVSAAIDLFQSKGVQVTSVEEICDRAEVAVRTFFNHFETREHLHDVIAHQRAAGMAELLRALADDPRPFAVRLEQMFSEMADYLARRPAYRGFVGEMLQRHPARGSDAVRGAPLAEGARELVTSAIGRGEIARGLAPDAFADVLVGSIIVLISNWSASEDFDVREAARETAKVLSALSNPGG